MTKALTTLTLVAGTVALLGGAALAHPGHVEQAAGHSHWGETAAAVALGLIAATLAVRALIRRAA